LAKGARDQNSISQNDEGYSAHRAREKNKTGKEKTADRKNEKGDGVTLFRRSKERCIRGRKRPSRFLRNA